MLNHISSQLKEIKSLLESKEIENFSIDKILKTSIYLTILPPANTRTPLVMESIHETFKKIWDNIQNEEIHDYMNKE